MGVLWRRMKMMGGLQIALAGLITLLNAFLIYTASTNNQSSPRYIYALLYFYNAVPPLLIALYGWKCISFAAIPETGTLTIEQFQSMVWLPIIGSMCSLGMNGITGFLKGASYFRVIGDFRCFPALFNNTNDSVCDSEYTTYTLFSSEWNTVNISKWMVYCMYNTSASWMLIFSLALFFTLEHEPHGYQATRTLFCDNVSGRMLKWILGLFVFVVISGLLHVIPLACVKTICYCGVALGQISVLVAKIWKEREIAGFYSRPSAWVLQAREL